jgi:hypothetical protein
MVDAPDGRNQGYYRSGAQQADGTVTVWRPWAAVADWYFWENQGAGIAVADLDGGDHEGTAPGHYWCLRRRRTDCMFGRNREPGRAVRRPGQLARC